MNSGLDPALTVGAALALGITAQAIARTINVPGIVLLLLFGVVMGPELLGVVQPQSLGDGLHTLIGLSVSVILFEGGMSLSVRRLRASAGPIRKLVTLGAAVTCVLAMLLAHYLLGFRWKSSLLFGTLVMVTGPTVIAPLLRRIRVTSNVHTVLEAEGILVDAVGALAAVVALEVVLGPSSGEAVVSGLQGLITRWGVGLLVGGGGGALVGFILRKQLLPEGLGNAFALAFAMAIFATSNHFASESGIVAVIFAGLIVGNLGIDQQEQRELMEFKEQLSTLLIGLLFILLAAGVRLSDVVSLGLPGVAVVVLLMVAVRPIAVLVSTLRSGLSGREKAFLSWLAPRGIVAAAVASLFAQRMEATGMQGGAQLKSLVFLVIAMTVVIQGVTGALVAGWLGVRRKTDAGVAFLGADALARELARRFVELGEEVVLVDLDPEHCRAAEEQGFKVIYGNAMEERTLSRAQVDTRRFVIAATGNEGLNLLFARTLRRLFKRQRTLVLTHRGRLGVRGEDVKAARAEVMFGRPIDVDAWSQRAEKKELLPLRLVATTDEAAAKLEEAPDTVFLPFAVIHKGTPIAFGSAALPKRGELVEFLVVAGKEVEAHRWLTSNGFSEALEEPTAKVIPALA